MSNVVMHIIAMLDDIVELHIQTISNDGGNGSFKLIHILGCLIADGPQFLIRIRDMRRECSGRDRPYCIQFFKQFDGIRDCDPIDQFRILQPGELLLHFICCPQMLIWIRCFAPQHIITDIQRMRYTSDALRHDIDITEDLLILGQIVSITVRNDWNMQMLCHSDDTFLHIFDPIHGRNAVQSNKSRVISQRLKLNIIVELHARFQPCVITIACKFPYFAVLAG